MMNLDMKISFYLFLMSFMMLYLYKNFLLCLIISLEFMMMMLVLNMYLIVYNIELNIFLIMNLLIMAVCEGVLSLTMIVVLVRTYGNDYVTSFNLMKW